MVHREYTSSNKRLGHQFRGALREANAEIQPGGYFKRFDCPDHSDHLMGFFIVRWTVTCFRRPAVFSLATVTWRSILPGSPKCSSPEPDAAEAHRSDFRTLHPQRARPPSS